MDKHKNQIPVDEKVPITVIIPTKNEEANIDQCLKSISWAKKIYVVDSNSSDETCQISEDFGAEVVQFEYKGRWPKKKNWAINNLKIDTDWIFILDADERVSVNLKNEIQTAIQSNTHVGYYVRWKFIFLGNWMKYSWSHGWMLRIFKKGYGDYEDLGMGSEGGWDNEVHENIIVQGTSSRLKASLLHETNQDLSFWIEKQNSFSTWNAYRRFDQIKNKKIGIKALFSNDPLLKRKAMKALFIKMPFRPLIVFMYLYIFRLGFLDGRSGFYFCILRSIHEFNISAKMFEIKRNEKRL